MKNKKTIFKLVIVLALVYFISQFLRSALGIAGESISNEFQLNYEEIGRLGGIFFLSFAIMQIPLGILLDRYNPLRVIFFMLVVIYFGTLLLSFSNNYQLVFLSRVLQGIGCSACLMGPLVYLAKKSSKYTFSKLSGVIMGVGGLGALFAFSPFYKLNLIIGWQSSFLIFSFLILLVTVYIKILLKYEKYEEVTIKPLSNNLNIFRFIFVNKNFLMILPMSIFGYASFAFLLTLWGNKFLSLNQAISKDEIANILMLTALFWTIGSICFGVLNQKTKNNKPLVVISALIMIILLCLLAFLKLNNYYFILLIFCFYGFLGAFTLIVLDHYRKLFDQSIFGKVITSANLFNFGGVFFVQWITGVVIEYSTTVFGLSLQQAFSICFVLVSSFLFLSIIFYLKSDEGKS